MEQPYYGIILKSVRSSTSQVLWDDGVKSHIQTKLLAYMETEEQGVVGDSNVLVYTSGNIDTEIPHVEELDEFSTTVDLSQGDDAGAPVEDVNDIPRRVGAVEDQSDIVSPVEEVELLTSTVDTFEGDINTGKLFEELDELSTTVDVAQCDDAGAPVEEVNKIPWRVYTVEDRRDISVTSGRGS